ncbi:hypothetical protein D3C72_1899150 [compost metagenome]
MDQRLAKEVKRLNGEEQYFDKYTTDEDVYKLLGILEVSETWTEFKNLHKRKLFRGVKMSTPNTRSLRDPDGFDNLLVNIFKKGKPKK